MPRSRLLTGCADLVNRCHSGIQLSACESYLSRVSVYSWASDIAGPFVVRSLNTKDSLIEAVVQAHLQDLQSFLARLTLIPDPRERLMALVNAGMTNKALFS